MPRTRFAATLALALLLAAPTLAEGWQPVDDPEQLRGLFSGTVLEAQQARGARGVARFEPDGTGVLEAWGGTYTRRWEVKRNLVCIDTGPETNCFRFERSTVEPDRYRAENVLSGEVIHITLREDGAGRVESEDGKREAGAVNPTANEVAQELANPNTPLASLTAKLQFRTFTGDLPRADRQDGTLLLLQPSFPFPVTQGDTVFFRPAIPIFFDEPVFDADQGEFDSEFGMGDISFDLAYGRTSKSGLLLAGGIISSLPTATRDELGTDRWTAGPELLIGRLTKSYVIGAFPNHQWDYAGSGDADINLTTVQLFGTILPGGGWSYGSVPIMSYDHEGNQWTLPLNFNVGRTVIWNARPWKISVEINYYVEQADPIGPEWMVTLNVAPVVENIFASLFR